MSGSDDGDDALLEAVACAIADGSNVDWAAAEAAASSADARRALRRLRAAALIATAHRAANDATVPAPPAAPRTGFPARWGPFEIVSRIGGGAFGDVFVARDPALDRQVALKLLKPDAAARDRVMEGRAVNEGRAMARVRHPNVVTVFGAEAHDGRVGIWMELVRGRTLESILAEGGPLAAREAAVVGTDLCRALAAVHAQGLVHGDLKTQNALREEGGRILLMDFGASALMPSGPARDEDAVNAGTPYYMAPELFRGSPASARTDVYALGVLLYRLVTGSYPITGTTFAELLDRHSAARPRPLRDARPDLPADFVAAVEKAIAPDPALRYASAGEMEQALAATIAPRVAKRARLVVALAAAALAIAAAAIFFATRPGPAYAVTARLFRVEGGVKRPLVSGDPVARGDKLCLEFRASRPLHVYVLNEDAAGRKALLFPLPATRQNPLPESREPLTLPTPERQWTVSTSGGAEDIIVVASPKPLDALVAEIAAIPRAGEETQRLRGILGLEEGPDARALATAGGGRLADTVQALAEESESVTGVFVRRIRLENPGR